MGGTKSKSTKTESAGIVESALSKITKGLGIEANKPHETDHMQRICVTIILTLRSLDVLPKELVIYIVQFSYATFSGTN